jgi:hypothetical protein
MLPYSTVQVVRLEVVKPGGAVEPVDVAANSKEAIDESQVAMNIYDPNSKVLQVNLPKLEIGDVVHSVTRTTTERAYIPGSLRRKRFWKAAVSSAIWRMRFTRRRTGRCSGWPCAMKFPAPSAMPRRPTPTAR